MILKKVNSWIDRVDWSDLNANQELVLAFWALMEIFEHEKRL